jgi:hypothetical protein
MSKGLNVYCQFCGQKITGRPKEFRHAEWPLGVSLRICVDCYRQKPRCWECGLPMATDSPDGVCMTCSQSLRRCLACGEPVQSQHYEFDGLGPYCQRCYRKRPPCDICGAPLTNEQWRLSDGRVTCAHCHATAIYLPDLAVALYQEMTTLLSAQLGLSLNIPTGLALVDRNQLREVIRQQQKALAQEGSASQTLVGTNAALEVEAHRTLGLYARRGMRRGIYIQTGLPRMLFLQVTAHEFAHAWQGENCPMLQAGLVHEGFAEWVAYRLLGFYGYGRGQERMLARQDLYGQGLRWALDQETACGAQGLIEACRRAV